MNLRNQFSYKWNISFLIRQVWLIAVFRNKIKSLCHDGTHPIQNATTITKPLRSPRYWPAWAMGDWPCRNDFSSLKISTWGRLLWQRPYNHCCVVQPAWWAIFGQYQISRNVTRFGLMWLAWINLRETALRNLILRWRSVKEYREGRLFVLGSVQFKMLHTKNWLPALKILQILLQIITIKVLTLMYLNVRIRSILCPLEFFKPPQKNKFKLRILTFENRDLI